MLIKCPSCSKANDLNFESDVSCGHCKKTLRGYTYGKVKTSVAAIVIAFGAGAFTTHKVDGYTGVGDRYPIKSEYSIIEICLAGSQQALALNQYKAKKEDCICALSKVQQKYKVRDFNERTAEYLAAFDLAARACKADRASATYSG